jgi:cytochrome c oxidase subunit II
MTKTIIVSLLSAVLVAPNLFVEAESVHAASPKRVEVTAQRYTFNPGVLTLKKGEPVILVLKSVDVAHGLRFRELGIEVKAPKGGTAEVHFTPEKTGDFVGHCYVFCGEGHGKMNLILHVVS